MAEEGKLVSAVTSMHLSITNHPLAKYLVKNKRAPVILLYDPIDGLARVCATRHLYQIDAVHPRYVTHDAEIVRLFTLEIEKTGGFKQERMEECRKELVGRLMKGLLDKVPRYTESKTSITFYDKKDLNSLWGREQPELQPNLHLTLIKILAQLGKGFGYDVWCPDRAKSSILKDVCIKRLKLNLEEKPLERVKAIDVLWLKDGKVVYSFDVENSTNIYDALSRGAYLPEEMNVKKFIVLPRKRETFFKRRMTESMFKQEWDKNIWKKGFSEEIMAFYERNVLDIGAFTNLFA